MKYDFTKRLVKRPKPKRLSKEEREAKEKELFAQAYRDSIRKDLIDWIAQ